MILGKLDRESVVLPLGKTLHYFSYCFLVLKKNKKQKGAEIVLISLFKMPDKTLSKEKVNLLISGSVSSDHLNSRHLAYVTQQAIAGDQNNVLCQWTTLKDYQNTFRHRNVVQSGKKADGSFSTSTSDRRHFVCSKMSRTKAR